jgi:hypothetical protein
VPVLVFTGVVVTVAVVVFVRVGVVGGTSVEVAVAV